jgi:hypothetical protein
MALHRWSSSLGSSVFDKVAETELGECPASEIDDEEEDPSNGFYEIPLVGDDPWKTRADALENQEPRDGSDDDSDDLFLDPHLREVCTWNVMVFWSPCQQDGVHSWWTQAW